MIDEIRLAEADAIERTAKAAAAMSGAPAPDINILEGGRGFGIT